MRQGTILLLVAIYASGCATHQAANTGTPTEPAPGEAQADGRNSIAPAVGVGLLVGAGLMLLLVVSSLSPSLGDP